MKKTAAELKAELDALRGELETIMTRGDEATDEELSRAEEITNGWDEKQAEYDTRAAFEEKRDKIRSAAQEPSNREAGSPQSPEFIQRADDPYEDLTRVERHQVDPGTILSRARTAVERSSKRDLDDKAREQLERLLERDDDDEQGVLIARHILLTGSQEYRREFRDYIRSGGTFAGPELRRAALALSPATAGGALVPFTLDPTIILTNAGVVDPIRSISHVETIATNSWNGVTSAGVNAAVIAENTAITDQTPAVAQKAIPVYKFAAWVFGGWEVLGDSNFATQLPRLIADGKQRIEGTKFAVGSGSSEPTGVVTAVKAVTTSRVTITTAATLAASDVFNVANAMEPRYSPNASWLANKSVYNQIRQLSTVTSGGAFWTDLGMGRPANLIGASTYEASSMSAFGTATTTDVLLAADMSQYYVIDRVGLSLVYEANVFDTTTGAPKGQSGWVAWWRMGADMTDPGAGRLLRMSTTVSTWT